MYQAYYEPNAQRNNLTILTAAQATKVVLEATDTGVLATGVEFVYEKNRYVAKATREVILSAGGYQSSLLLDYSLFFVAEGSIQTPQLLELSGRRIALGSSCLHFDLVLGIGKEEILKRYNIPTIIHLPIGENLRQ
jgi:choline dehydrogenase-like flavoprotein